MKLQSQKTAIRSEAVFSEDNLHRVFLRREWDRNKPSASVIMINPSKSSLVQSDLTTVCVLNNLDKLDYGSVDILNMYSVVTDKLSLRFHADNELLIAENDEYIEKSAEKSQIVILAWGQIGDNNKRVKQRQYEILEKLAPYAHKIKIICDNNGRKGLHPLTPQIRNEWILETFDLEGWKKRYIQSVKAQESAEKSKGKAKKAVNAEGGDKNVDNSANLGNNEENIPEIPVEVIDSVEQENNHQAEVAGE